MNGVRTGFTGISGDYENVKEHYLIWKDVSSRRTPGTKRGLSIELKIHCPKGQKGPFPFPS